MLERGLEWKTESLQLPIDPKQLLKITHQFIGNGISILVGTGVGGGSLVYSGVSLRAPNRSEKAPAGTETASVASPVAPSTMPCWMPVRPNRWA